MVKIGKRDVLLSDNRVGNINCAITWMCRREFKVFYVAFSYKSDSYPFFLVLLIRFSIRFSLLSGTILSRLWCFHIVFFLTTTPDLVVALLRMISLAKIGTILSRFWCLYIISFLTTTP